MINWPAALPQSPAKDYEEEMESGVNDPEQDLYAERTRTYAERSMKFSFRLSMAEWGLLRGFYIHGTSYGQAPFTAPWLTKIGFDFYFCRFLEPPTLKGDNKIEGKFNAEISVEVIAGVPMDGDVITYGEGA